jgi:hypothetical protein
MSLTDEIFALVDSRPGVTTREILLAIRRRRADVLTVLARFARERILCSETGRYGARVWRPLDRFPGEHRPVPGASVSDPDHLLDVHDVEEHRHALVDDEDDS